MTGWSKSFTFSSAQRARRRARRRRRTFQTCASRSSVCVTCPNARSHAANRVSSPVRRNRFASSKLSISTARWVACTRKPVSDQTPQVSKTRTKESGGAPTHNLPLPPIPSQGPHPPHGPLDLTRLLPPRLLPLDPPPPHLVHLPTNPLGVVRKLHPQRRHTEQQLRVVHGRRRAVQGQDRREGPQEGSCRRGELGEFEPASEIVQ